MASKAIGLALGLLLAVAGLGGCDSTQSGSHDGGLFGSGAKEPPAIATDHPLAATVFVDGKPTADQTLTPGSASFRTVTGIINSKGGEWTTSLVNFPPSLLFRTATVQYNVSGKLLVANYQSNGGLWQSVARLTDDEVARLNAAVPRSAAK